MLILQNIQKDYRMGTETVHALKGVSLAFRSCEFVAILGPSGCGKTTMLNLIGGLDRYDSGDIRIDGRSTAEFKDRDWDNYRNHSVGFVFQSYNLIQHQSVLSNVELALTLSGVGKAERRRRAVEALRKVGLGDQLRKRPNQLSGGQMQRVAIARALVNNPSILLADEPTGALDTESSIQIMELLQEVSRDRLVIMVTHNPELAEQYATRIVRALDGQIVDDTNPVTREELIDESAKPMQKRPSMSFLTALSLSKNNLMTKKARTILTAFAGSIGIIGIALILSLSNGIQNYINRVQEDTLSTYPLTLTSETMDMGEMIASMSKAKENANHPLDKVYSNTALSDLADNMMNMSMRSNDLSSFMTELRTDEEVMRHVSGIKTGYDVTLPIYTLDNGKINQVNPSPIFNTLMGTFYNTNTLSSLGSFGSVYSGGLDIWQELLENHELLETQYEVIAGRWPERYDEVILIVDKNNEINDIYLYSLGIKNPDEVQEQLAASLSGKKLEATVQSWTYEELLAKRFRLLIPSDGYIEAENGGYQSITDNELLFRSALENSLELKVVGIIRPSENAAAAAMSGAVGYLPELTDDYLTHTANSALVQKQLAAPETDVFSGLPFNVPDRSTEDWAAMLNAWTASASYEALRDFAVSLMTDSDALKASVEEQLAQLSREEMLAQILAAADGSMGMSQETVQAYLEKLSDDELRNYLRDSATERLAASAIGGSSEGELRDYVALTLSELSVERQAEYAQTLLPHEASDATLEENLSLLGYNDRSQPGSVSLYAATFEDKDAIVDYIERYNARMEQNGEDSKVINYTDYVGLLMSSITTILKAISYVLVAFVSISLVVSSIMIGIITYISVLERTREIGVLRAMGASKRDISRVFNAETLIVGFAAGVLGIVITVLLNIPISLIVQKLTGIPYLRALLPPAAGVALVLISMVLTLIAGLLPSRIAAKRDPVEALRSE